MCVIEYLGCTSSSSINFDPLATVDSGDCWEPKRGCLELSARNFGCTLPGQQPCPEGVVGASRITIHEATLCTFSDLSPPPLSPPPFAPGAASLDKYRTEVSYSATFAVDELANYTKALVDTLQSTTGIPREDIDISTTNTSASSRRKLSDSQESDTASLEEFNIYAALEAESGRSASDAATAIQDAQGSSWESAALYYRLTADRLTSLPIVRSVRHSTACLHTLAGHDPAPAKKKAGCSHSAEWDLGERQSASKLLRSRTTYLRAYAQPQ
eukprot:6210422-Pleurochrysis_carterae.AAC.1